MSDKPKPYITGTLMCDECKKYRPVLIQILERHETPYGFELKKKNLCVYHFAAMLEFYEDKYLDEEAPDWGDDDKDVDPNDPVQPLVPDGDGDKGNLEIMTLIKCDVEGCVWNGDDGICEKDTIFLTKMAERETVPLFICSEYLGKNAGSSLPLILKKLRKKRMNSNT